MLNRWESFYVIVGSAAGALIGLQFVVITLITDRSTSRLAEANAAFLTPTIIHFGVVFLLSAVISAPWTEIGPVSAVWGLVGLGGMIYAVFVARHLRVQTVYRPVLEDWLFHLLLPLVAYVLLAGGACFAQSWQASSLFVVAAALLLLLLVGIHNAWDAVTYHVFGQRRDPSKEEESGISSENEDEL